MTVKNILLIPHLRIHNANALSSPFTIGFPAVTAWLGAVHALERKLKAPRFDDAYEELRFTSVAVVCHAINLQTYKGENDFVQSIVGTGNPLDKNGNRPSFIEEARCHLDVSLVIEYGLGEDDDDQDLPADIAQLLRGHMKIAGGDILACLPIQKLAINSESDQRKLMGKLMPGYCLIERRDLMRQAMQDGQDAMDALLDYLALHHRCEVTVEDEKTSVNWTTRRKTKGWLVPIATGFQGISALGQALEQRDADTPHRFAESVVTLGEFIMPYRIDDLDNMLWHYAEVAEDLYLCQQNKPFTESIESEEITHG